MKMNMGIFGQHDPEKNPPGENQFGMEVYICGKQKVEYNMYMK
jgi:hypothetical protein